MQNLSVGTDQLKKEYEAGSLQWVGKDSAGMVLTNAFSDFVFLMNL
jgi:hypothetical protein